MSDARHGRKSLMYFSDFLAQLEAVSGRKAVILFSQGGTLFPSGFYEPLYHDMSPLPEEVGNLVQPAQEAGASAVASRASLYVASPRLASQPDNAGRGNGNLASQLTESAGGIYTRAGFSMDAVLARAGRECCLYRIALKAPENPSRRIYGVRVEVNGRTLPHTYQVRFMSTEENWMRRAGGYIARPETAAGVPLLASLVPVSREAKGWDLAVKVSFPADDLVLVPMEGKYRGRWRLAALVNREDDGTGWKFFLQSELHVDHAGTPLPALLHSHRLRKMKPGRYRRTCPGRRLPQA